MIGSNGKDYMFLLKGHEDLRQDERVMQLFGLVNTLLLHDPDTFRRNLTIQVQLTLSHVWISCLTPFVDFYRGMRSFHYLQIVDSSVGCHTVIRYIRLFEITERKRRYY